MEKKNNRQNTSVFRFSILATLQSIEYWMIFLLLLLLLLILLTIAYITSALVYTSNVQCCNFFICITLCGFFLSFHFLLALFVTPSALIGSITLWNRVYDVRVKFLFLSLYFVTILFSYRVVKRIHAHISCVYSIEKRNPHSW